MFDPNIPKEKSFLNMLGNIESLYFVTNEIDHNYKYCPNTAFEKPFKTAIHQLLCIVNPLFSTFSESVKIDCYNTALNEIDKWIQNGGSVELGDMDDSSTFAMLYDFFRYEIWKKHSLLLSEQTKSTYNTRLHIISTNLRLFAELKQLERELERHSITYEVDLPFRNIVYDSTLCWIEIENKRNKWEDGIEDEILNTLFDNGLEFFKDSVGFLPYAEYPEMIFMEVATEFIRRADELTIEYRM